MVIIRNPISEHGTDHSGPGLGLSIVSNDLVRPKFVLFTSAVILAGLDHKTYYNFMLVSLVVWKL